MGFLKFLGKPEEKRQSSLKELPSDDLELPPPPQMSQYSSELPTFSGPKLESQKPLDLPEFDIGKPRMHEEPQQFSMPTPQPFDLKLVPEPIQVKAIPIAAEMKFPEQDYEKVMPISNEVVEEQEPLPVVREAHVEKSVFVKGSRFRVIIENIDSIAASQRLVEVDLARVRRSKDLEYEKLSRCLEDVQRTLMFVDRNVFEV